LDRWRIFLRLRLRRFMRFFFHFFRMPRGREMEPISPVSADKPIQ
jgi:hypothetical protein